jgi:alpha/beta superfamily hydrolase
MDNLSVSFPSDKLSLEGILALPQGAGPFPAVVVCHPHPLYGGSMDNNVVCSLCETLTRQSLASFRFNFRGVGGSQGEFSRGIGEQEDIEAAISFISRAGEVDPCRIVLAGYSAGAGFGLPVGVNDARIKALAAISLPLDTFRFDFLKHCRKPKLLVSGSMDDYTPAAEFLEFCQNLPDPKQCEIIEGADHFWQGYESRLASLVSAFFVRVSRSSVP